MADLVKARLFTLLTHVLITAPSMADMADPTRPPPGFSMQGPVQAAKPPLLVTGVFLMGKRPYAVVDGVTVRVGDRLANGRVKRIEEQGVWLQTPNGRRLLGLIPDIDKKMLRQGGTRMERTK